MRSNYRNGSTKIKIYLSPNINETIPIPMNNKNNILRWLTGVAAVVMFSQFLTAQNVYNIIDYGAVANKTIISTSAIQRAVDSCAANGGGTVYFPPGDYLSGTILLKDNITLFLEAGATLYASRDTSDYIRPLKHTQKSALIYANNVQNISLRGKGKIHGQAVHVYEELREIDSFITDITENARTAGVEMKRYYITPPNIFLLLLTDSQNILIEDISLVESPFWTCHLLRCEQVTVRGVYIYSSLEKGVNADGLDISSCKNVTVSDCTIITGDDAIVLKTRDRERTPCENITVTNCIISSSSTALKLGTESKGDFRHILFNNCVIRDSNRGLSIVVRDGATVSDVVFSNITIDTRRRHFNWWGNGDPIWIYLNKRRETSPEGMIKNVVFENIIAHAEGTSKIESFLGKRISNIKLKNVQILMKPESYPDKRADHAFVANNVIGLTLDDLEVRWTEDITEEKWGNALRLENVDDLNINQFRGRQGLIASADPAIFLENIAGGQITNANAAEGTGTFLSIAGKRSSAIILKNIDLQNYSRQKLQVATEFENTLPFINLDE